LLEKVWGRGWGLDNDVGRLRSVLVKYDELHKSGGGIHCSTLPLIRDEA
jgi:arginine deiminase